MKAIAIRGTLSVKIAHPDKFIKKLKFFNKNIIEKSKTINFYRRGGTLLPYLTPGEKKPHGVKNMSEEFWSNEAISCIVGPNP